MPAKKVDSEFLIPLRKDEEELAKTAQLSFRKAFKSEQAWKDLSEIDKRKWANLAGAVLVRRFEQLDITLENYSELEKDILL